MDLSVRIRLIEQAIATEKSFIRFSVGLTLGVLCVDGAGLLYFLVINPLDWSKAIPTLCGVFIALCGFLPLKEIYARKSKILGFLHILDEYRIAQGPPPLSDEQIEDLEKRTGSFLQLIGLR